MDSEMQTKTCTKCGRELPATLAFFYRHPQGMLGLRPSCKGCCNAASYVWDKRNRRARNAINKRYRDAHPDRVTKWNRTRHSTIEGRLANSVGAMIWAALKGKKAWRRSVDIIGYSMLRLRCHLESRFRSGMTWENYGRAWHIDHIRPVASFTFESPDDPAVRQCWALSNLRPLWAKANMRKHAKWDGQTRLALS